MDIREEISVLRIQIKTLWGNRIDKGLLEIAYWTCRKPNIWMHNSYEDEMRASVNMFSMYLYKKNDTTSQM